jgi:hypothetical protein
MSILADASAIWRRSQHCRRRKRIGFLHEDKAAAIGRLMAVDGQRDPIKVVAQPKNKAKPWRLVTGMHRLIGARLEGIQVFAIEVSGKPEDLADLEASENLHRRPLAPIERAKFTAALVQAAQDRIARENGNLKQQQLGCSCALERVKARMRPDDALTGRAAIRLPPWHTYGPRIGREARHVAGDPSRSRVIAFLLAVQQRRSSHGMHPVVGERRSQLRMLATIREEDARRRAIEALLADGFQRVTTR